MSIDTEGLRNLGRDLNPDDILSEKDLMEYIEVIMDALSVHVDRERVRKGLWKKSKAIDQTRMVKIKTDRVMNSLEVAPTREQLDNAVEELLDIINYSVFAVRQIRGTV